MKLIKTKIPEPYFWWGLNRDDDLIDLCYDKLNLFPLFERPTLLCKGLGIKLW